MKLIWKILFSTRLLAEDTERERWNSRKRVKKAPWLRKLLTSFEDISSISHERFQLFFYKHRLDGEHSRNFGSDNQKNISSIIHRVLNRNKNSSLIYNEKKILNLTSTLQISNRPHFINLYRFFFRVHIQQLSRYFKCQNVN